MRKIKFNWFAALSVFLFLIAQTSKYYSISAFSNNAPVYLFKDIVYLTSIQNNGAAFSILQGQSWILVSAGIILVLLISFRLLSAKNDSMLMTSGMAVLLGGSLGNLVDRILRGHVVDFIGVKYFSVLNLADIMINIGIAMIILDWILLSAKKDKTT